MTPFASKFFFVWKCTRCPLTEGVVDLHLHSWSLETMQPWSSRALYGSLISPKTIHSLISRDCSGLKRGVRLGHSTLVQQKATRGRSSPGPAGLATHGAPWHACAQIRHCGCREETRPTGAKAGSSVHFRSLPLSACRWSTLGIVSRRAAAFGPFGSCTIISAFRPGPWRLRAACTPAVSGRELGRRGHCLPGQLFLSTEKAT